MKVDTSRLKKGPSEVPPECQQLIDRLRSCNPEDLAVELAKIETWTFGKCELCHWIEILDYFDDILMDATKEESEYGMHMSCDVNFTEEQIRLLLLVLNFTTLLIEHSFSRHLYNSIEHLTALLQSINLDIVLGVLNLLYMFSKRSNFLSRLGCNKKTAVSNRLKYIAENWGGKDAGFGLADCCCENIVIPASVSSFYYEYYKSDGSLETVTLDDKDLAEHDIRYLTELVCSKLKEVTDDQKYHIFCRVRLSKTFKDYKARLLLVQARLQALSVLIYSDALTGYIHQLIYPGFLEELVELLELQKPNLVDIRAAALRTLTSIIHLDRNAQYMRKNEARLNVIIDVTGASSYHGFLPSMVRSCINNLILSTSDPTTDTSMFPLQLATALFSFLYHLASYEGGAEALVSCGMMEGLLKVINWSGSELEHITFVTRAVRVIDLITNIDMGSFQSHDGLNNFIDRLSIEVNLCRQEQSYEIQPRVEARAPSPSTPNEQDEGGSGEMNAEENEIWEGQSEESEDVQMVENTIPAKSTAASNEPKSCLPQRAALLKSMLNFLKKAIQDTAFADSIRRVMDGSLPKSLKHIISNSEYYGPSLFLLATDVVTVYVFQEPSFLSSLQDNGLTDVILQALLKKDVPATREVLGSLPNVFSALCLNRRGLASFVKYNPFDKLFKVLLSPVYLSAMRRRRSSDPIGDTASNLGNAMDELMRNQPSLKTDATKAIIRLLKELVQLGTDPKYVCWRPQSKNEPTPTTNSTSRQSANTPREDMAAGSSDDEDDDEEEASTSSHNPHREENQEGSANTGAQENSSSSVERIPIALIDYILNVMKFVDAILSNNSTDDHCREFVEQGGLEPLLQILALPNLPVTSCNTPITATAQAVAAVCKSILSLAHEPQVLQVALTQLASVVDNLKPLRHQLESPNDSILLRELANCQNTAQAFSCSSATPILHAMNAVHGYVVMLVHVCRTGQQDIRTMSLNKWSHDKFGKKLLQNLVQLYTALVWESTLLLAMCTDDISAGCNFGKEDIDKMLPNDLKAITEVNWNEVVVNLSAMEGKPDETCSSFVVNQTMDVDNNESSNLSSKSQKKTAPSPSQLKYIKSLLLASSRLGRALAELFGLLVKLSVGTTTRQRRGQNFPATPQFTSPASKEIARVLSYILVDGLSYHKLPPSPIPKLKLIFLICSVGFTSPMLFDEKRFAYHLMLQKFVEEGGLEVFFEMFKWALTAGGTIDIERAVESSALPDGTGEFLDAWLILLEKMVNPRAILESPHVISATKTKAKPEFDPIQYLINVHKSAYFSVMHIWGCAPLKTYGLRMSESILTILKHIFRGEKLIAEKYVEKKDPKEGSSGEGEKKDVAEASASSSGATATAAVTGTTTDDIDPRVNQAHLQRLLDMGFSQSQSVDALLETGNVEQAADRILSGMHSSALNNDAATNAAVEIASNIPTNMDVDVTEEVIRAILLSIGDPSSAAEKKDPKPGTSVTATTTVVQPEKEAYKKYQAETPLAKTYFDDFSNEALVTCLKLLDALPEAVYRVCDLLVMISKRNGDAWRDDMLNHLVNEISECLDFLINVLNEEPPAETGLSGVMASKTAVRIHLFTLLFEGQYQELKIPCASAMVRKNVLPKLVQVIVDIEKIMKRDDKKTTTTPKWLAPLFLLVDLYEKVAVYTQRKTEMHKITTKIWKWYDLSTAKWNTYSAANNKIINDAYWANESSVRITFGRQRYTINFSCMTQVNDETGNHRPVILALKCMEKESGNNPAAASTPAPEEATAVAATEVEPAIKPKPAEDPTDDVMDASPDLEAKFPGVVLRGLEQFNTQELVGACVRLMSYEFDKDTLHAIMRVCLRLTRTYENAQIFARENGVRLLLQMKQNCGYVGFTTLATLLIRHVIEEPKTLTLAMENVIYSRTAANLPTGCKELLYMTRQMSSAISRNSRLFKEVSQQILRIDVELLKRNQLNEDNRYLLKSLHPPNTRNYVLDDPLAAQAVKDLLAALVQPDVPTSNATSTAKPTASTNKNFGNDREPNSRSTENRFSERFDRAFPSSSSSNTTAAPTVASSSSSASAPSKEAPKLSDKTLVSKADILKILGDSVRSYQTVSLLITQYTYKAGCVQGMNEDTSALSYILDKLLYVNESGNTDRECGNQAQFLIAGLAATSDVVSVQYAVVTEVKSALLRAFMMPESMEKHLQIEMIAGLIPVMIDSYVTADNHILPKSQQSQSARYNIFFIMLRKGLISDLAKAAQYLDLSGPHTVATINFILKPLELLLRMSNEPVATSIFNKKKPFTTVTPAVTSGAGTSEARPITSMAPMSSNAASVTTQGEEPSTSTANLASESTVAQDETMTDDSENTDYDISTVPESGIETTSEAQIQVHLSEILNSFLREDINNENESNQMATEERNAAEQGNDYPNILNETLDSSSESADDTVSNASENEGLEIEEEEDEASDNEDEVDEHSELDVDEETRQFIEMYDQNVYSHHIRSPNIPELERDLNEDILMIQYSGNNAGAGANNAGAAAGGANENEAENNPAPAALPSTSAQPETTHRFTFSQIVEEQRRRRLEQSSNAENSADPLANNDETAAAPSHPLLVRRHSTSQSQDGGSTRNESRGTRSGRARRFNYLSMNGRPTDPPYRPPIILQRLLGPSNTSGNGTVTIRSDSARVVLMDNTLSFITNNADDENADNDQVGYMYNRSLQSSNSTSTALTWWFEESKILGFESQPDVCLTVCDELVPDLERHKAQDLAKTRGKRKKKTDETATEERPTKATTATIENLPSEATQATTSTPPLTSSVEFAQALNLMDTSEPQFAAQPAAENQNITTASDQLQEMQINPDAERLTAAEQNQANIATENPAQGDAEMADAVAEQEAETRSDESDDSAEENVTSQRMISMYYNSDDDDDSDDDNDDYEDSAVAESGTESGQGESDSVAAVGAAAEQASNMEVSPQPPVVANQGETEQAGAESAPPQQVEDVAAASVELPTSSAEPSAPAPVQDVDPAIRSILGDLEIPEGIDPSFLAALPSEMRDEVIAEHLRQQRIRVRAAQPPPAPEVQPVAEVNPEFLAALPPNIQEEVLAQQRLEQQRQAAVNVNPNDPVDAAAFFQNLNPQLRQAILTDMEESQMSVLPPELAQEAQNLRRDWETRNRQMMQMRLINQIGRNLDPRQYLPRTSFIQLNSSGITITRPGTSGMQIGAVMERQGGPLIDHEALSSILVLLFIDDPNISTLRLYRVIKNLCFHVPTRKWIIRALLSIIEKCSDELAAGSKMIDISEASKLEWLNIRLDSALSCRTNVFVMKRPAGTLSGAIRKYETPITVHPKASPIVCRHTIDLLIFLAKSFPVHFLPLKKTDPNEPSTSGEASTSTATAAPTAITTLATASTAVAIAKSKPKANTLSSSSSSSGIASLKKDEPSTSSASLPEKPVEFWDILGTLDAKINQHRKMSVKASSRPVKEFIEPEISAFEISPFAQLIKILAHDTVKNSSQLTDKVLRLLSLVSVALPDNKPKAGTSSGSNNTAAANIRKPPQNYQVKQLFDDQNQTEAEQHLRVIVQVLTSKACSEDGLEDATTLLLNLSKCSNKTRYVIHHLLLHGACSVSQMVLKHIHDLMHELKQLKDKQVTVVSTTNNISPSEKPENVVPVDDEDLASSSNSSAANASTSTAAAASSDNTAVRRTNRGMLQDRFTKESVIITAPNKVKTSCDLQLPSMVPLVSKTSSQAFFLRILKVITQIRDSVYQTMKSEINSTTKTIEPNELELSPLSETLKLDELWDTLSECLKELEDTSDHHAVLVLQPTVEAFFLVHASSQSKNCALLKASEEAKQEEEEVAAETENESSTTPNQETVEETPEPNPVAVEDVTAMESAPSEPAAPVVDESGESSSVAKLPEITPAPAPLDPDQKKFLQFAETHRVVLNQILRQSTTHLADGPFAVMVDHTRILDFDIKRRYFRTELERLDEGIRREELAIHVHRVTVFEDSFRELYRRAPEDWKNRFYIVFEDEEGQDAGGLLREWYVIISREIFNPMYALFCVSPGDRVTYMINPSSHANPNHLCYYKFVGRVIAKAIYDNKLLECYFTRSFYKHILGIQVKYTDMESEDYDFYKGLVFLIEHQVSELGYDLTFSLEVQEFGVTEVRDLIPNGRNIVVTEETKLEYVHLVCQLKMSGSIRQQLNAFLEGFYDIIPKRLISIFNEQELELLISGLPNIDIEDLKANTEYHKYQANSIQVQWFWRALRSFDQADRAKFLQFVTGTSKVPLQGFASLEGMNGTQKFQIHRDDRSTNRLPSAHTCFNQLDLPVYKTYDKLRSSLLKAIHECSEGFGFA